MAALSDGTAEVAGLVAAFSMTHVGLSNVRQPIISACGAGAKRFGLVGRGWRLPSYWLGDSSGNEIWPDAEAAGRQIFRVLYSAVAFGTLGAAAGVYADCRAATSAVELAPWARAGLVAVAALAQGISITSLLNPSPLSLVPGFRTSADAPLGLERDDSLKLAPYGLTRITRHPLILPVVPWGLANAALAGGRATDVALFGGLAVYALVGCKAQDERAAAAAAVGTVFARGDLTPFYDSTSFTPFAAVLDGRQKLRDVVGEVAWVYLCGGVALGWALEEMTLRALESL